MRIPDFLYIHIPFCLKKCMYCDFLSVPYNESLADAYISALCRELHLKNHLILRLQTIFIGGGTPSLLSEDSLNRLFKCLRTNFIFSDNIEITVEANPATLSKSKIDLLLSSGVNRLSIGVQSFNDTELKTLGRMHSSGEAFDSIDLIIKTGLKNISLDLMYGVPGQTMKTWQESASKAVGLSPSHISAYELTLEKDTPLYELTNTSKKNPPSPRPTLPTGRQAGQAGPFIKGGTGGFSSKIIMPDEGLVLALYDYAIDYFSSCGYEHYEISNFALPGSRCRHNLNYWNRGQYIGAGAGAHSFINGVRSKNTDDINRYIEILNHGTIPEVESSLVTSEEALKEFIFLGLRKTEGISIAESENFGLDITGACKDMLDDGYFEIQGDFLRLTRKGLPVSNAIIVKLFERLGL